MARPPRYDYMAAYLILSHTLVSAALVNSETSLYLPIFVARPRHVLVGLTQCWASVICLTAANEV